MLTWLVEGEDDVEERTAGSEPDRFLYGNEIGGGGVVDVERAVMRDSEKRCCV